MSLDESTRRLSFLVQRDLRRLVERERARDERGETIQFDSVSGMATWETRRGEVIGRWYAEVLASYVLKDRILRWAWAGRTSHATPSHAEVISREGQSRGVRQLAMSVVGELDEEEAAALARLGVLVARGQGLQIYRGDAELSFVGLFDSPRPWEGESSDPVGYSVPPPAVTPRRSSAPRTASSPPAGGAYRSLPPITEVYGPRVRRTSPPEGLHRPEAAAQPKPDVAEERRAREPARAVFVPVASAALAHLAKVAAGYQQALFILEVHTSATEEKRRLLVTLVAVDAAGVLRSLDPGSELVAAAARMVEADRADGNGPWRKLSALVKPKADGGATLSVDVI